MKIRWKMLAAATVTGGAIVALMPGMPYSPGHPEDENMVMVGRERSDGTVRFTIDGKAVRGLYPGAVKRMRTTVVNPSRYRLRVQKLSGNVVSSSRRGCSAGNLRVNPYDGKLPLVIEPYSRMTLPGALPITMPMEAPSKCAGVRFTIALSGVGSLDDRR